MLRDEVVDEAGPCKQLTSERLAVWASVFAFVRMACGKHGASLDGSATYVFRFLGMFRLTGGLGVTTL